MKAICKAIVAIITDDTAIREQLADPLHIDVYKAAEGIIELFEENLKGHVAAAVKK